MAIAVFVLAVYAVMLKPLGFILPTAIAAGILSYQISPAPWPQSCRDRPVAWVVRLVQIRAGLGNIVAYRIPTPAKLGTRSHSHSLRRGH